jgi:hypothetical protein
MDIVLYMRSLLFVESFDFRPSDQYSLVWVIPSCFPFAKMCLCQVSLLLRCSSRYLTSSSWGSCTLFIWTGRNVSLRVVNVTWSMGKITKEYTTFSCKGQKEKDHLEYYDADQCIIFKCNFQRQNVTCIDMNDLAQDRN